MRPIIIPLIVLVLAGCTVRAEMFQAGQPQPVHLDIPPGHRPPPGECRIWFPDRPPGQQSPPESCRGLKHKVPPGAYLVRG